MPTQDGFVVLFTTPIGPYKPQQWNNSLTDLQEQRFAVGQDIFTLRGHMHCQAGHGLAQNISVPSVYLEYPRWHNFEDEVRRGYDYVAISFMHNHIDTTVEMCRLVKRVSPKTQVVLGYHGARGVAETYSQEEIKTFADHLCFGEGISYMRNLLGEPVDAPISITHLSKNGFNFPWLDRHPFGNVGVIAPSVGCPNACDFCGPTLITDNQHILLLTPKQVFEEIKRLYREEDVTMVFFVEEDSFLNKDYIAEIGELVRTDAEFGLRKIDLFAATSIRGISQFTFDEIALMGFSGFFFGFESRFAPQEGYEKRVGYEAKEAFLELRKRGINVTAGWIMGWDFHDRVNVEDDFNYFASTIPTAVQLTRLCCFPGTPLYYRLIEEERIDLNTPWEEVTFYGGGGYWHRNFEGHEIDTFLYNGYKRLYETWGPSIMRRFEVEMINPRNRHPKEEPYKKFIYNGSAKVKPGERPYKLVYPNQDRGFEFYQGYRTINNALFGAITSLADRYDQWRGVQPSVSAGVGLKAGKFV